MPKRDDAAYFRQRAEAERKVAANCEDPAIAATHLRLAEEYERRALTQPLLSESA